MGSYRPIQRVAIVGAGPTGIACAKFLLAENHFEAVDIFEQRDRVGGVWNLSARDQTLKVPAPQTNPLYGYSQENGRDQASDCAGTALELESPMYDYLETNIPKDLMQYSDTPFPSDYPLYPSHEEVLEYLERYADEVRSLIKFNVRVDDVRLASSGDSYRGKWQISYRLRYGERTQISFYDAVVVASGHYTIPNIPEMYGLDKWDKHYPGVIMHSKAYRRPEDYSGQTVLVIGNSASGADIAAQIAPYSAKLVLSSRSASIFENKKVEWRQDIDEIEEWLSPNDHDRAVRTKSGIVVGGFDKVIFATGYLYSFPFMRSLDSPLITDGRRTIGVYQHLIHNKHAELAFPVLNWRVIPFGLAENQAAVIARLWSGRLPVPSQEVMDAWELNMIQKKGDGKQFHVQNFPEDGAQMNDLHKWASSAIPREGLENDGQGRMGKVWDRKEIWIRSQFVDIKSAYTKRGDKKRQVKTLADLGFIYEDWKNKVGDEEMDLFRRARCPSMQSDVCSNGVH